MASLSTCWCCRVLSALLCSCLDDCRNKVPEERSVTETNTDPRERTSGSICSLMWNPNRFINQMELVENLLEDWPESLDMFGSVWMDALGVSRAINNWSVCLTLVEHLLLDLLSPVDLLLEHRAVCLNILGPAYSEDPYVWMLLHSWEGLKMFCLPNFSQAFLTLLSIRLWTLPPSVHQQPQLNWLWTHSWNGRFILTDWIVGICVLS